MAFTDIDAAILVGAFPRKQGMERKDLLQRNAKIFESQGKSLDQYAKKSVKVNTTSLHAINDLQQMGHFPNKSFSELEE